MLQIISNWFPPRVRFCLAFPMALGPLFSAAGVVCAADELHESFENGVPKSYVASGGKLSISSDHIQAGRQALRWDCRDGDAFVIQTGPLGNINVWTGYGNYMRSCIVLPTYLSQQTDGHLLVEFRSGETTAATLTIPFVHVGWQKLVYHYSWHSSLKWIKHDIRENLDNIRISAHGLTEPTAVWFDDIFYNTPRDFRDARNVITKSWHSHRHDFSNQPAPTAEQLEELEAFVRASLPQPNPGRNKQSWDQRISHLRKDIETKKYFFGNPLDKPIGVYFGFLNAVASDYDTCTLPESREELAEIYNGVHDWLQEQGLVVNGAIGKANNYVGRTYVDAVFKGREILARHGTLDSSLEYIKWAYDYDRQVFSTAGQSMDYFHNEAARLLSIVLLHGDPVERWHHFRAFRENLAHQIEHSIKPDGSLFHHGFHYYAYGIMGVGDLTSLLARLSGAGFPVPEFGLDATRRGTMPIRWYGGGGILWSLSGRAANGKMRINPSIYLNLARAYAPYRDGQPDAELMGAYLRLVPKEQTNPPFAGYSPEPTPNGFRTMPFAALAMHRRGEWLVGIKGFSKYAASGEAYANANRYGLFMSMGQMELLTEPQPFPSLLQSGTRPDEGYNWCAIEGATTIHAPLDRIACGNGTRILHSPETFVGGVSNGRNGLFALHLNLSMTDFIMRDRPKDGPKPAPLQALKTWFCFDNRIICLGSGVSTSEIAYPVRTNLFQKFLDAQHTTTVANGEPLTLTDQQVTRDLNGNATLTDPYGNSYVVPSGQAIHLKIGEQTSRDSDDKKNTTGNYATAWIDHGLNPSAGEYEYAVLVQPTPEETASFVEQRPYRVLQKDAAAHIVIDQASHSAGYAVFDSSGKLPTNTPLVSVAQPCLVMLENHDDYLLVALTNPDTRAEMAEPQTVSITLKGTFTSASESDTTAVVKTSDGQTTLSVPVKHAESVTVRLDKK